MTVMDRALSFAGRALLGLAVVIFIGYLLIYGYYAISLFGFPFDYDQGEGFELVDTLLFSRGEWPYRDNEAFPFYSSNYPPLFHVIAAPLARVFGAQYWIGRALGFASTLVNAGLITYAVYREGGNRTVAALSGLAFLASNTIYHIGPLFRQHMFMVMWETLAVVVLARARRWRGLALGGVCLVAAGYTKQLAVITAATAFTFLFLRHPRRAVIWALGVAALSGAIFLWMDASTGGQWSLNAVAANVNQFIPGQARDLYLQWFGLHGALIIPAALLVLYELYFARLSLYSVWFVVASAGAILSGKWGAGDSYFATAIAAMCVLSGVFAARALSGAWRFEENYLTRFARRLIPAIPTLPAMVPEKESKGGQAGVPLERLPDSPGEAWQAAPLRSTTLEPGFNPGYPAAHKGGGRGWARAASVLIPLIYLTYALAVRHMPTEGPVFGPLSRALRMEANTGFDFHDAAGWVVGYARLGQIPTEADVEAGQRIVAYIESTDSPVLSEEAGFQLAAGREVITNPTQLKNLYDNGLYDPSALVAMIEARAFAYVIFRAQFYPPPVLEAVAAHYETVDVIPMNGFEYAILAPKHTGAR